VASENRPVLFIFAGKAHPADEPGKEMIRRVLQVASMPDFEGHVLFVEGYDLRLARRLVSGVDVWLNNPIFPLEASGTSGMKAGFNGVMNLSVLDGWWGEGYAGDNGWAIKPASEKLDDVRRNVEESRSLYELLQDRVTPLYYDRGAQGFSPEWIRMAKRSIMTLLPAFNSQRMVGEYLARFYMPASQRGQHLGEENYKAARDLAAWKRKIRGAWPHAALRALEMPGRSVAFGERLRFVVGVKLDKLSPEDVQIELLLRTALKDLAEKYPAESFLFKPEGKVENGEQRYVLEVPLEAAGKLEFRIRAAPRAGKLSAVRQVAPERAVVKYTPPADPAIDSDQFSYAARSKEGFSAAATVAIRILDDPAKLVVPAAIQKGVSAAIVEVHMSAATALTGTELLQ